jgi:hypothetical protein
MKSTKTTIVLPVLASFMLMMASCKKNTETAAVMTDEEAAEVIALSVSGNTEALADQTAEIADAANAHGAACAYSNQAAVTKANTAGLYTWNYVFNWKWTVVCTAGIPNTMNVNYKMKGSYDAPRMASNDSAVAAITVGNLLSGTQFNYNGTYTREGSQVSKIRNQNSFSSKVVLSLANVKVNKVTGQIDSGMAAATITGTTTAGNSFSYGGTVTFNGSRTATITLNNGSVYNISW